MDKKKFAERIGNLALFAAAAASVMFLQSFSAGLVEVIQTEIVDTTKELIHPLKVRAQMENEADE